MGASYKSSNINNCYAIGSVTGNRYSERLGGLVGDNSSNISNCYAIGNVTGLDSSSVGGLVGYNEGRINSSYATGNVEGGGKVGGLTGIILEN